MLATTRDAAPRSGAVVVAATSSAFSGDSSFLSWSAARRSVAGLGAGSARLVRASARASRPAGQRAWSRARRGLGLRARARSRASARARPGGGLLLRAARRSRRARWPAPGPGGSRRRSRARRRPRCPDRRGSARTCPRRATRWPRNRWRWKLRSPLLPRVGSSSQRSGVASEYQWSRLRAGPALSMPTTPECGTADRRTRTVAGGQVMSRFMVSAAPSTAGTNAHSSRTSTPPPPTEQRHPVGVARAGHHEQRVHRADRRVREHVLDDRDGEQQVVDHQQEDHADAHRDDLVAQRTRPRRGRRCRTAPPRRTPRAARGARARRSARGRSPSTTAMAARRPARRRRR